MPGGKTRTALIPAIVVLAAACAHTPRSAVSPEDAQPWWVDAGPCRVWVAVAPMPGRTPAWDPGPSVSRLSMPGDCRNLQAGLPDGAVLVPADRR